MEMASTSLPFLSELATWVSLGFDERLKGQAFSIHDKAYALFLFSRNEMVLLLAKNFFRTRPGTGTIFLDLVPDRIRPVYILRETCFELE